MTVVFAAVCPNGHDAEWVQSNDLRSLGSFTIVCRECR